MSCKLKTFVEVLQGVECFLQQRAGGKTLALDSQVAATLILATVVEEGLEKVVKQLEEIVKSIDISS